jgi:hypothetical protein
LIAALLAIAEVTRLTRGARLFGLAAQDELSGPFTSVYTLDTSLGSIIPFSDSSGFV